MEYYCGIDVSLEQSSVCVIDGTGSIVREATITSDPDALIVWFSDLGLPLSRIGLEAGPLSQWLYRGLAKAGFAVELLETRRMIPPADFIPLAEETGIIIPITEWVVRRACRDSRDWADLSVAVVDAVINLGRSLGMATTAEGVETRDQASFLTGHGCEEVQGSYYARPMPAVEMAVLVTAIHADENQKNAPFDRKSIQA